MVEVIQNGKDKEYEVQCKYCRSDLKYHDKDSRTVIKKNDFFDRYMDCKIRTITTLETAYRAITCPVCGNEIKIECVYLNRRIGTRNATKEEIKSGTIKNGE